MKSCIFLIFCCSVLGAAVKFDASAVTVSDASQPWEDVSTGGGCRCNEGFRSTGSHVSDLDACKQKCASDPSCLQLDYKNNGWCNNYPLLCDVNQNCDNSWQALRKVVPAPTCPSTKLTTYCSAVSTQEECEQSYTEESPNYPQKCSWINLNCLSGEDCELPTPDQFEWVQQAKTQCGSTAAENTAAEAAIGRANMHSPGRTDNSHLKAYGGTSIPLAQCQEECLANPMCRGIEVNSNSVEANSKSGCCFMYSGTSGGGWSGSCWYIKKNGKVWKYE